MRTLRVAALSLAALALAPSAALADPLTGLPSAGVDANPIWGDVSTTVGSGYTPAIFFEDRGLGSPPAVAVALLSHATGSSSCSIGLGEPVPSAYFVAGSAPALAGGHGGDAYAFTVATDNLGGTRLYYRRHVAGTSLCGGTWEFWSSGIAVSATGYFDEHPIRSAPAALEVAFGSGERDAYVFVNADDRLWYSVASAYHPGLDAEFGFWQRMPNTANGAEASIGSMPTAHVWNGYVWAAATRSDGLIHVWRAPVPAAYASSGPNWLSFSHVDAFSLPPGHGARTACAFSSTSNGPVLVLTCGTTASSDYLYLYTEDGTNWNGWANAGSTGEPHSQIPSAARLSPSSYTLMVGAPQPPGGPGSVGLHVHWSELTYQYTGGWGYDAWSNFVLY